MTAGEGLGPSLAELVFPRRPAGTPYEEGDDRDAEALLEANGLPTDTETLIALLGAELGIVQAAAARLLGARGERSALPALERLARSTAVEETARVQAAYALARLEEPSGHEVLRELLRMSPEASPAPLQAAGALARLGDPSGYPIVRAALESPNPVTAMVACKQLYFFASLAGRPLPDGGVVDVYDAFARALARPEPNIVGEARAQLDALGTEEARAALEA